MSKPIDSYNTLVHPMRCVYLFEGFNVKNAGFGLDRVPNAVSGQAVDGTIKRDGGITCTTTLIPPTDS